MRGVRFELTKALSHRILSPAHLTTLELPLEFIMIGSLLNFFNFIGFVQIVNAAQKVKQKEIFYLISYYYIGSKNIFKVYKLLNSNKSEVVFMNDKEFVSAIFNTFNLDLNSLPSRIAFQKTVYLLQSLGLESNFNFRWHSFGPYSSSLAKVAFNLSSEEINNSQKLTGGEVERFLQLKKDHMGDSRFLEMMADIVYLRKNFAPLSDEEIFTKLAEHHAYLNDPELFKLAIERLSRFNLI